MALSHSCNRLREYLKEDFSYSRYKAGDTKDFSDFDRYCVQHCEDINTVLNSLKSYKKEISKLRIVKADYELLISKLKEAKIDAKKLQGM